MNHANPRLPVDNLMHIPRNQLLIKQTDALAALATCSMRLRAASAIMTLGLIASTMTSLMPVYAATTLTVTNALDSAGPATSGSLRQVLEYMQFSCYGAFTINFAIPGAGPHTIAPASSLPAIDCANTTINGYSQSGASANSLAVGNNAVLKIKLDRPIASTANNGLFVSADNVTIKGLVISKFTGNGILINDGTNTKILGNFIGTDTAGSVAQGNATGIRFQSSQALIFDPSGGDNYKTRTKAGINVGTKVSTKASVNSPNKVGGINPADRNVISGNTGRGIALETPHNEVVNNHIGTDKTGISAVPNGGAGIDARAANLIVDGNFISYNLGNGVVITESDSTISNNLILNNGGIGVYAQGTECAPGNIFIRQNNIGPQGSLGIDLGNAFLMAGVRDVNGAALPDSSSCYQVNGALNGKAPGYPVVNNTTYEWTGASVSTTINAQLNFAPLPNKIFTIDLFDNSTIPLDTANKGVGRKYVASIDTPATDSVGSATFQISNATAVYRPTMTSTAPSGFNSGTSEFSVQQVTPFAFTSTYTNFTIPVGGNLTQAFTLTNISASSVTVAMPTTNLASFTVALAAGCNNVAIGATCNVNVTYAKNVVANETAVLTLVQGITTYKWNLVGVATASGSPPTISFAASPANILVNGTTVGTLTVTNPNVTSLTANAFTFNYLPGLVNAGMPSASSTCAGATPTAVAGVGNSATTTGFTIPGSGSCTFSVTITSATAATYSGNIAAGLIVTPAGSSNATPFSLNVGALGSPVITSAAPPSGIAGQAYSFTASATGGGPITWSIAAGSLPPGLNLNSATGTISGSASAGTSTFTLRATNMAGQANQATSINIIVPIVPVISLSVGALDFGNQNTGTASNPLVVTISNTGNASFDIRSITGIGDFAHVANCPTTLAPQTSCTLNVTFSPLTAGLISGLISVNTTALSGSGSITLSGVGILVPRAIIVLNPGALTFSDQALGSNSAAQILFISNTGLVTLDLRNIAFSSSAFTRAGPPAVENPNNVVGCGGSVAPRTSCAIGVVFGPSNLGINNETLTITHNATLSGIEGTSSIGLRGIATQRREPLIRVSSTSGLNFTDQVLDSVSSPQPVNVTNTGTIVLNVGSVSITPTNANTGASDFSAVSNCSALNPGASCTINVSFTPNGAIGGKAASLNIASNATNVNAGVVSLSGNALPIPRPVVRLSATSIGFGNVISGSVVASQRVTVTNVGILPLNIAGIIASGNFGRVTTCTAPLSTDQSCTIDVTFNPSALGSNIGAITINSNATPASNQVTLSGTGCRFLSGAQQRHFVTNCG